MTIPDEHVEEAAKAMFYGQFGPGVKPWDEQKRSVQDDWRKQARRALSAVYPLLREQVLRELEARIKELANKWEAEPSDYEGIRVQLRSLLSDTGQGCVDCYASACSADFTCPVHEADTGQEECPDCDGKGKTWAGAIQTHIPCRTCNGTGKAGDHE